MSDRFWSRVDTSSDDGCWPWLGYVNVKGYGRASVEGRAYQAHRYAYEQTVGPIPDGLTLDHLCRNRRCVRPSHLEPVTNRENVLRGEGPTAANVVKTECVNGHAFTTENTYTRPDGTRECRSCYREVQRRAYWANPEVYRSRKRNQRKERSRA